MRNPAGLSDYDSLFGVWYIFVPQIDANRVFNENFIKVS
jgi:hypothetical protein